MGLQLLLLLPTLASCSITINIQTSADSSHPTIAILGNYTDTFKETEKATFRLSNDILKRAVKKYSGKEPEQVFLHNSTVWNNLDGNSSEVKRTILPVRSKVLCVHTETIIADVQEFDNDDVSEVDFTTVMGSVINSVESEWLTEGFFDVDEEMSLSVDGSADMHFSAPWGVSDIKRSSYLLSGEEPDDESLGSLADGQVAVATLSATKITQTVLVEYTAKLEGNVTCNYPSDTKQQFQSYDINDILKAGNCPLIVKSMQMLTIQYHTKGKVVLTDKETNQRLAEVKADLLRFP